MEIFEARGSVEQRAQAQGERYHGFFPRLASEAIGSLAPWWLPSSFMRAFVWGLGHAYLRWHRPYLQRPEQAHHLRGVEALAGAFGASPAMLYGFHAVEAETGNLAYSMGCSSLAFGSANTASGHPKLAYNHDFPPAFEPFLLLRRNLPDEGYRSLAVTYPCLMGAIAGVNEHGLAVSVNQAFATDGGRGRQGIFVTMLVQECLDHCRDVEEAIGLLTEARVAAGCMVSLVDAGDDRATVELSPTRACVRREEDPSRVHYTFNNYRVVDMRQVEVPLGARTTGLHSGYDIHLANLTRERRWLQRVRPGRRYDDAAIKDLLSDHDDGPGDSNTICRHDDILSETIVSAIMDTRRRSLKVLFGRPCEKTHAEVFLESEPALAVA